MKSEKHKVDHRIVATRIDWWSWNNKFRSSRNLRGTTEVKILRNWSSGWQTRMEQAGQFPTKNWFKRRIEDGKMDHKIKITASSIPYRHFVTPCCGYAQQWSLKNTKWIIELWLRALIGDHVTGWPVSIVASQVPLK